MDRIYQITTLCLLVMLLGKASAGQNSVSAGQSPVRFWATSAEEQAPKLIWHMAKYVDWKVTFSIENTSSSDIIVYGWDQKDGTIDPVLYLLRFNKKTNSWDYPNSSNAPTPWEKESSIMKHEKLLKPGESLAFSRAFSRVSDCGRRVIFTAQVSAPKSKKTHEIRSEEYVVPCSDQKPDKSSIIHRLQNMSASPKVEMKPTPSSTANSLDVKNKKEILDAVNGYWQAALSGNDTLVARHILKAPVEFWTANQRHKTHQPTGQDVPVGDGDMSHEESRFAFSSLKAFARQIHDHNVDLVKTALLKANETEAIVKIDYATAKMKAEGTFTAQLVLLSRDDTGWRIFLLTNGREIAEYNPRFAEPSPQPDNEDRQK